MSLSQERAGALLMLAVALSGLAGCAQEPDDGVATARSPSAAVTTSVGGPAPAADQAERARQYVACLRQQGVEVADPDAGKQPELDRDRPQDKAAAQACRQYLPVTARDREWDVGTLREYSACMRREGFSDFPDPVPGQGLEIPKDVVRDPAFRAADQACWQGTKPGAGGKG
jgi:hypothetical protein